MIGSRSETEQFFRVTLVGLKQIKELTGKVEDFYLTGETTMEEIREGLHDLSNTLKTKERLWKQKSRVFWL